MNRSASVYFNDIKAGCIELRNKEFVFTYVPSYLADTSLPPIAIAFPKSKADFRSPVLFPFFFGLLAEGANKDIQCASLKIDENDHFTRLLKTAGNITIGAITVREER